MPRASAGVLAEDEIVYEIQVPAEPGLIPGATAAKMLSPQNVVEFLDAVDAHKGEIRLVSPSGEAGEFRLDVAYIRRAIARYGATIGAVYANNLICHHGVECGLWAHPTWGISTSYEGPSPSVWRKTEVHAMPEDRQAEIVARNRAAYIAARSSPRE